MQVVIDSLVSIVTGVFTLGEADLITIGINMIMGLSMFFPMTVGQLSFGKPALCLSGRISPWSYRSMSASGSHSPSSWQG